MLILLAEREKMSSIHQLAELPADVQQEVLDFMDYVIKRRGINLRDETVPRPRWLSRVNRGASSGESISDTVAKLRSEERW